MLEPQMTFRSCWAPVGVKGAWPHSMGEDRNLWSLIFVGVDLDKNMAVSRNWGILIWYIVYTVWYIAHEP